MTKFHPNYIQSEAVETPAQGAFCGTCDLYGDVFPLPSDWPNC